MLTQLPSTAAHEKSHAYWQARLPTLPPAPELPLLPHVADTAVSEGARFSHHGGQLPEAAWSRILKQCAQRHVSPTSFLLTLYGLALARYATSERFVVNVLYTMRHPVHPDVQRVVGNFTSSILFEFNSEGSGGTLSANVMRTLEQLWSDLEHSHVDGISVMQEVNRQSGKTFQAVAPFAFVSTLGLTLSDENDTGAAYLESGATPTYSCVQTPQTLIDPPGGGGSRQLALQLRCRHSRLSNGGC